MRRIPAHPGFAKEHPDIPAADLEMLAYVVWYARKRSGRIEDVAAALWWENPYLRLSDPATMASGWDGAALEGEGA